MLIEAVLFLVTTECFCFLTPNCSTLFLYRTLHFLSFFFFNLPKGRLWISCIIILIFYTNLIEKNACFYSTCPGSTFERKSKNRLHLRTSHMLIKKKKKKNNKTSLKNYKKTQTIQNCYLNLVLIFSCKVSLEFFWLLGFWISDSFCVIESGRMERCRNFSMEEK